MRTRASRVLKRHRIKNYPFDANASNDSFCVQRVIEGEAESALGMLVKIQNLLWRGCRPDELAPLVAYFESFDQGRINNQGLWDLNTWREVAPPANEAPSSIGTIEATKISSRLRHFLLAAKIQSREQLREFLSDSGRKLLSYRNTGKKTLEEAMELAGMEGELYCKCCGQSLIGARARDGAERVTARPRLGVEDDTPPGLADLIAQNLDD